MIRRALTAVKTSVLFSMAAVILVLPGSVAAQNILDPVCSDTPNASVCQVDENQPTSGNDLYGPDGVLTKIANILSIVTGIIAVFVMIVGGVKYVTSGGKPESTNSARNTLIYGLIGVLVAASAQAIIVTVLNKL